MTDDLIERLRVATESNVRPMVTGHPITCSRVPSNVELSAPGYCRKVINGHVCKLTDPHPSGYVHQCWCNKFGSDQLGPGGD